MQTLLSGLRLKGLEIQVKSIELQLTTLINLILEYCPNLEYLSLKNIIIKKNQARELPNRLRLLKFLSINYSKRYYNKTDDTGIGFLTVDDLIAILENLPFLRVFTSQHFYDSLLKFTMIKKHCRQGKLVVSSKAKNLNRKWMKNCCGPCCTYRFSQKNVKNVFFTRE
uniref:Uncharacterized protein n=1 Tax=Romanomermis culicivorax TaxID=13658 RepID=A0A915I6W9_ROMCU